MILAGISEESGVDFTGLTTIETDAFRLGYGSKSDTAVFEDSERHLIFAAQGRVDNRQTLRPSVGLCASDPEYIWNAYLKWGRNCMGRILGDWLFVAYHTQSGELFMARDQNGKGEFFYKKTPQGLLLCSAVQPLITRTRQLNPLFVISKLSFWNYKGAGEEIIFRNIRRLLPGHTLTYRHNKLSIERYWYPENVPLKHYARTEDYAEELLDISREAVRCRIPDNQKVASMLSGGFDSGAVSVLAAEALKTAPLVTFSHIPLYQQSASVYPNVFNDESDHIDSVVTSRPTIRSVKTASAHISPVEGVEKFVGSFNTLIANGINAFWLMDIYEQAATSGFDVLLEASTGNVALSYQGIKTLLPMRPGLHALKQQVIKPALRHLLDYRFFSKRLSDSFINPALIADYKIRKDVLLNRASHETVFRSAQEEILCLMHRANRSQLSAGNKLNLQILDPTRDVRIIEHCLAIPNQFFFNEKGENKQVIRKMMAGRLPDKVLLEKRKGLQASDIVLRVLAEIDRVEEYYHRFENNPTFRYFIDTPRLANNIRLLREQKLTDSGIINNILVALMLGVFLEHNRF
jgi:asparagine synthase (glutamine-hydrolysing)